MWFITLALGAALGAFGHWCYENQDYITINFSIKWKD